MTRTLRYAGYGLAAFVALLALLAVLALTFDWNRTKPWINDKLSEASGRSVAIDGDLSLSWQPAPEMQGWRRHLPWPHWHATRVRVGNPDWARSGPLMAQVPALDFTLDPWRLPAKEIRITQLRLDSPALVFEKQGEQRKNWQFGTDDRAQRSDWHFGIDSIAVASGRIRYLDADKRTDLQLQLATEPDGSLRWQAGGRYNGEPLQGRGSAGSLLALRSSDTRYPVDAQLTIGKTQITASGSVTNPSDPRALDIRLSLAGASMADLFPISGLLLPETPKFDTRGRVVGRLMPGKLDLRYEDFTGRVGGSDIAGTLAYRQQSPRTTLRGEVVSQRLRLADLGRLIGAGDRGDKPGQLRQPRGRVLPVSPFKTGRWDKMDVDVRFTGRRILRREALPVENLDTRIRMQDGVLTLDPLAFGIAGGELKGRVRIDGHADPAQGTLVLDARRLKLSRLFPKIGDAPASIGLLGARVQLSARGNSVAALLGSASGELHAAAGQGSVSKFMLEAAGLNIANAAFVRLFGDRQVPLNCLVADLRLDDGIALPRTFVLDTPDATIEVAGAINLQGERYDLTLHPQSKGVRVFSLRSPLYVRGSFGDPEVGVDRRSVALRAGAALALGAVAAPVAGLLALVNPGGEAGSPCASLLRGGRR